MNEITFPITPRMKGRDVRNLQEALRLVLARNLVALPGKGVVRALVAALDREAQAGTFGDATRKAVALLQKAKERRPTGKVDAATAGDLNAILSELGLLDAPGGTQALVVSGAVTHADGTRAEPLRIEGLVVYEDGLAAGGLGIRLYGRSFGGGAKLLDETTTGADGRYAFSRGSAGEGASREIRAVAAAGEEVPLSTHLNELGGEPRAIVNLVAPARLRALAPEHERLTAAMKAQLQDPAKLAGAREDGDRHDLTILNRATGWDARLVALAASAARLSADPGVKLSAEPLYGLLRAGLPSDPDALANVRTEVVERALATASDRGIVRLGAAELDAFLKQFAAFSSRRRLAQRAPGSRSTYAELLEASGLDPETREKFARVHLAARSKGEALWDGAAKAGLPDEKITTLKRQGKLAFLTLNNAPLATRLAASGVTDPLQLVARGLHEAARWIDEIDGAAGIPEDRRDGLTEDDRKKLDALVPPVFAGKSAEARRAAWSGDMARKVRRSYPTHVVAQLVEDDAQDRLKLGPARAATAALLKGAADAGFRLGQESIATFLEAHPPLAAAIDPEHVPAARQAIRMLHRVYQITPSHESMTALLESGITSAYDVVAIPEAAFVARHEKRFPSEIECRLVHRKARQVTSVAYNLFTVARKLHSEPPVFGLSGSAEARERLRNDLVKRFPTIESLFGSTDYCACEHCRSVLSPAAYFVDLLQFLDVEPEVWSSFEQKWEAGHGGVKYGTGYAHPYAALLARRPDLPHVPLTCENTNTAMPYIDLVNEILEYHVANASLDAGAARDTGGAATADLLAEPQHVLEKAYDVLRGARYPLALPFDLWLESVRAFCRYFETPLPEILEAFRADDELYAPARPYDRAAIFLESLGISPAEREIFADPAPLAQWYARYGYGSAASATTKANDPDTRERIDLRSAKTLSRRLGITYAELVRIVRTAFVNPKLAKTPVLCKLDVGIDSVRFWRDPANRALHDANADLLDAKREDLDLARQRRWDALSPKVRETIEEVHAFDARVAAFATRFAVPAGYVEEALRAIPFGQILVLADPAAGCDFDETTLQYASGTPADDVAFLKINVFVRLWRKLGWTIEETDRALEALMPANAPYEPATFAKKPLEGALLLMAHLDALDRRFSLGTGSREKLLTLWSDLTTTGTDPLYARLFLAPSALQADDVFDHPLGDYLSPAYLAAKAKAREYGLVKGHLLAVEGALQLTADDVRRVLEDAGKSLDTAELSVAHLSLLHRHAVLSRALGLRVGDLVALRQLSGLTPFAAPLPDPVATLADDRPFSQTMRFVEIAEEVKRSGVSVEDLDFLLRHRFDPAGKHRPDVAATRALLGKLSDDIRAIRAQHAVPADPGALAEDALRHELGLVLPSEVVERFLAMMSGTAELTATAAAAAADQLPPEALAGEPRVVEVRYDGVRGEQKLTFRGVLLDAEKAALLARHPSAPWSRVLESLLADIQAQQREFFDTHLRLSAAGVQPARGFLTDGDFELLFGTADTAADDNALQERVRRQRRRVATAFLPFLQERLVRQLVLQTMTAHAGAEAALVEPLVTDAALLGEVQPAGDRIPLVAVLSGVGPRGIDAKFYESADLSGNPTTIALEDADTGLTDACGRRLRPDSAGSVSIEGHLEVPAAGPYRFVAILDKAGAAAKLLFDHLEKPVLFSGAAAADRAELGTAAGEYVTLKPGVVYRFTLIGTALGGGELRLLVQGETLPKGPLAQLVLHPAGALERAEAAAMRLQKAVRLATALGLGERDLRHVLALRPDLAEVGLSRLPASADDVSPELAKKLFGQFLRLAGWARLKREAAGGTDDLVGVLEAIRSRRADEVLARFAAVTRRDTATVAATAAALQLPALLTSEAQLVRLWDALRVVERLGVSPASIVGWTRIASDAATPEERFAIARDLRDSIRARLDAEGWRRVAQPIFDRLRQSKRDALAACARHALGLSSMEQLYEYFLLDPAMEPVVQTSRLRLAIGSVQLFVQRCLLNLEKLVHPSAIVHANRWDWMSRYRVWEANRKMFLFPENWLDPEFRDDKTHLFEELEGALVQGDVSADMVEDAFAEYLAKLDAIARLDIVAMHLEPADDPAQNRLHVFGRKHGHPHEYFYRRHAHGMWTPWEPVSVEMEGDHLVPVVWRERLHLFWVTSQEKPDDVASTGEKTKLGDMTVESALGTLKGLAGTKRIVAELHWSSYRDGKWTARQSGGPAAMLCATVTVTDSQPYDVRKIFVHVSKEAPQGGEERGLFVHVGQPFSKTFYLAGRNATPEEKPGTAAPVNLYSAQTPRATMRSGSGRLSVTFERIFENGNPSPAAPVTIVDRLGEFTLVACNGDLPLGKTDPASIERAALAKPVFLQNASSTFFLEPEVTEQTIEEWQGWVAQPSVPELGWDLPGWWDRLPLAPSFPRKPRLYRDEVPEPISSCSILQLRASADWLVNAGTALALDGQLIGPLGRAGLVVAGAGGGGAGAGVAVGVHPASDLPAGAAVVSTPGALDRGGLEARRGGLNVVGCAGLSAALAENLRAPASASALVPSGAVIGR